MFELNFEPQHAPYQIVVKSRCKSDYRTASLSKGSMWVAHLNPDYVDEFAKLLNAEVKNV